MNTTLSMLKGELRPLAAVTIALMAITAVLYPLAVTGIGQAMFDDRADGSLLEVDGVAVGSSLVGQAFEGEGYFHPRPSAAGSGYDAAASSGTNKGPTDRKLADSLIGPRVDSLVAGGVAKGAVPSDAVTASASGLDPHISPANAYLQVARVAAARGADASAVRRLLDAHVEGRQFGFFGEPRVNVLELNLALDASKV